MVSNIFSDLGSFILWMLVFFVWIGAIFALFYVITDLFRDRSIGTGSKVLWFIVLILVPWLGSLIYLIARGRGMAERSAEQAARLQKAQEGYIRDVASSASSGPAAEIEHAKSLLDSGAISQQEFDTLKAKALS